MTTSANESEAPSTASGTYIHGHHASVLRSHSWRTVENSAAYITPYLVRGSDVLDVGSGPGTITVDMARRVIPGRVVGLDSAQTAVTSATRSAGGLSNVTFIAGDATAIPFEDDSFDVVHAHQVLQHLPDPVAALREFRRVVKPGGVVGVREVDYIGTVWYPELEGLTRWMELYQQTARANGGEPNAGRRLTSWATAAGFTDVEATATIWSFTSGADRDWWGTSWSERILHSEFASSALRHGHATVAELEEISRAWLAWRDDPNATFFMPHGEIIARG